MRLEFLNLLRCPASGQRLAMQPPSSDAGASGSAWLVSEDGRRRYPVREGVPRFVPESNYAASFGMQWNQFRQTQLDSHSGHPISADRFWGATGWQERDLEGRWVLDAGCGAGRFAEVALGAGANVVALDYSSAVEACYANLRQHPNLHVVQGDIYALPFQPESFAFVYSLGVLQHTPDVAAAFAALPPMLRGGGRLCVDFYEKDWKSVLHPKYWLRPITKRLPKPALFRGLQRAVPVLLPLSRALQRVPLFGTALKRLVPVANYHGILPLADQQQAEWSLLDTFDWLSPAHDHPQTEARAREWMQKAGLRNIEILRVGHMVARGSK